jgi:hypothetical protein
MNTANSRPDAQEQLPAWLESLRAQDRTGAPSSGQSSFSTKDLIDDNALPSWMHPENPALAEAANSGKFSTMRPASTFAPDTDNGAIPPEGFSASSLIDEDALPSWVHGGQDPASSAPATPGKPFSASSLIDPNALPSWMTGGQPPVGSPRPVAPGGELGNMRQDNPVRPITSGQPMQSAHPGNFSNPSAPAQNISAGSLIDPQALPGWMAGQPAQQPSQPLPSAQPMQPQMSQPNWSAASDQAPLANQNGLSASSLLDMNSLPPWLREGAQSSSNSGAQPGQQPGEGMPASSLIDMNALPGWLREAEEQRGSANGRPGSSRVENVRVPSRPRTDMPAPGQSEVAANVLSSMLGVASTAPSYPARSNPFAGSQNPNFSSQPGAFPPPPPASPVPGAIPPGMPGQYSGMPYSGSGQPMPPQVGVPDPTSQRPSGSGTKPAKRGFLETIREWFRF